MVSWKSSSSRSSSMSSPPVLFLNTASIQAMTRGRTRWARVTDRLPATEAIADWSWYSITPRTPGRSRGSAQPMRTMGAPEAVQLARGDSPTEVLVHHTGHSNPNNIVPSVDTHGVPISTYGPEIDSGGVKQGSSCLAAMYSVMRVQRVALGTQVGTDMISCCCVRSACGPLSLQENTLICCAASDSLSVASFSSEGSSYHGGHSASQPRPGSMGKLQLGCKAGSSTISQESSSGRTSVKFTTAAAKGSGQNSPV
mmetsp:Transcript_118706/g.272399  ORF Transcript_118706/g.272399 Transcript_118706/m.272399 type:complete len:255 (-) Transcript_118706:492-1256(-)